MSITLKKSKIVNPLTSIYIDEAELLRSITKESFYEFVKEFWFTIEERVPVWNWHIEYLCKELQSMAERVFRNEDKEYDLIINISPGSTKTLICSVFFPAWTWTRMRAAVSICGSYTIDLARFIGLKGRDVITSDKYLVTYPFIRLRKDQSSKSDFMNTKRGGRLSIGVDTNVTGRHGHFLIIDDPINPKEAASDVVLAKANKWLTDTIHSRKVSQSMVPTILIMQRLHQNDCTNYMIETIKEAARIGKKEGTGDGTVRVKHICLPAEITDDIKPAHLKSKYVNGLMDPIRLDWKTLHEKKVSPYMYACQYLQTPIPAGGGMFKTNKIKIEAPPIKHWKKRIRWWDNAATEGGKGAYTVGLLMGRDEHDRYWILDVQRFRVATSEREELKKRTAEIDGKDVWIGLEQEGGSGGKDQVVNTVKMLAGYMVYPERPSGDKIFRADPYSVQVNYGNVFMKKADWNQEYLTELQYFPESEFMDQVDASSGAFNFLSKKQKVAGVF